MTSWRGSFRRGLWRGRGKLEPAEAGYASYQLIRNVLAAYAEGCSFCVVHDERRPDLREAWFAGDGGGEERRDARAVKVITWQELAALIAGRVTGVSGLEVWNCAAGECGFGCGIDCAIRLRFQSSRVPRLTVAFFPI